TRSVNAAPAAAPRRTREVLRIIREPSRCRLPTTGWDRRVPRPYGTRRTESVASSPPQPRLPFAVLPPSPPLVPRLARTDRGQQICVPSRLAIYDSRRRH